MTWLFQTIAVCLLAWSLLGCDRDEPAQTPALTPKPVTSKVELPERAFRFESAGRIVAIGDVHGDLEATRRALRLGGAIDSADRWIGGKLVVVQTGDQLDRGDDELEILELLEKLGVEARQAGGALHVLNGNHEVMNVQGDFRYVTAGGFADFAGVTPTGPRIGAVREVPAAMRGRAAAFLPGGPWALKLAERNLIAIVDDTVFVHGGVLPSHVRYGIARINAEAAAWMRGTLVRPPSVLVSHQAPIWTRRYSEGTPTSSACKDLETSLEALNADRMVVGHTTQRNGITHACGKRVWRIDVGMAAAYAGEPAVLVIDGDHVRAVSAGG